MRSHDRSHRFCTRTATGVLATLAALAVPAVAQEMMQLNAPMAEYKLGHFKYQAPQVDGWRQIANIQDTLSLVYIEQKPEDQKLDTRFGVAMESHAIPPGTVVEGAAALAELSRRQMVEARKADLVGMSAIQPIASIENLYTYRLLVHSPIKGDPDVYEVYYVIMSPDKKEYIVVQCMTKSQDYESQLYFQQFYGTLASLKYVPAVDGASAAGSDTKPGTGTSAGAEPATPPSH